MFGMVMVRQLWGLSPAFGCPIRSAGRAERGPPPAPEGAAGWGMGVQGEATCKPNAPVQVSGTVGHPAPLWGRRLLGRDRILKVSPVLAPPCASLSLQGQVPG